MVKIVKPLTKKEKKFGLNLKNIRNELGLTQDDVGEILGCVQSYISAFERGKSRLTPALAKVLIKGFKTKYKKVIRPEEFGLDKE